MSHARLSPSNHRWVHCPGSVREESNYTDIAGAAAIDGTGSHLQLEECLINGVRAEAYLGQIIGVGDRENPMGWLIHQDRVDRVQMCLDYVERRHKELKAKYPGATIAVEAESKSDPGGMFGRDDWKGTADITITVRDGHTVWFVEIIDYKDGRGWVDVNNNSQLISYAAGKVRPYVASGPDLVRPFRPNQVIHGVRMTIVQPKTNPVVRYQDITTHQLIDSVTDLATAARATDDPNAPVKAGKHCQWCKANTKRGGHCVAESTNSIETVKNMSKDIIATDNTSLFESVGQLVGDVTQMTAEQLSELSSARAGLIAAFDRVDLEIESRIDQGHVVPGYAMRPGNNSKVWAKSEEDVAKALKGRRLKKDQIYPAKLISPAQMLKLDCLTPEQKERLSADLISVKAGKLKLTKVAHGEEPKELFKDVAQCQTNVVQSKPEVSEMFAEVKSNDEEVSFF